jgi:hypothetical protein
VIEGVDLVCRLEGEDGLPLRRREPGMPAGGGEWALVERADAALRFRPAAAEAEDGVVADLRGGRWQVEGELAALVARVEGGRLCSELYPDPLARVWAALTAPHSGDFVVSLAPGFEAVDWGGVTHVGGGSHGALHAGDSLGPLLFVGCGPAAASEREQWTLRDVAPAVLEHFGIESGTKKARA